jgi:hypothetical protein
VIRKSPMPSHEGSECTGGCGRGSVKYSRRPWVRPGSRIRPCGGGLAGNWSCATTIAEPCETRVNVAREPDGQVDMVSGGEDDGMSGQNWPEGPRFANTRLWPTYIENHGPRYCAGVF